MTEAHLNIYDLLQSLEEQFPSNPLAAFSTQPSSISNSIETSPNSSSKTSIQYKQITIAKNLTKRIKAHPKTKQCIKTIKGKNFIKKRIQKICKIPLKNPKSEDLIKVSGSTLTSNATPKIGEYLQEITSLRQEDIKFNSSQEQINAFFLDGTLRKYKEEELKYTPIEFLKSHKISAFIRAKMVDWMIEVLANFHCNNETFFFAVNMMDRYLEKCQKTLVANELHLIGITCMFIASKYEEIYPIKLDLLCEKAAFGKFTKLDIRDKEVEILDSVDFDVMGPNIFSFVQIISSKIEIKEQLIGHKLSIFYDLTAYLSKMVLYEYSIIKNEKKSLLSAAVCLVAFKLFEQIERNFNISANIKKVKIHLELNENEILEKANQILLLAKNFDRIYQSSNNLKKFNKELFDELQRNQSTQSN